MGEFCNPSPQSKVTEAGADQTPCSWNLPTSSRAGGCSLVGFTRASPHGAESARGQPWAERAVTCPGADPGPVARPDLLPSWFLLRGNGCSSAGWGQAQPAPRDGGTYRDTAGPVSCRAWAGRNVWILPGLLRPCSHPHIFCLSGWMELCGFCGASIHWRPSGLSPSLPLALWSSASPSSSGLSPLFHCHGSSCSWNRV